MAKRLKTRKRYRPAVFVASSSEGLNVAYAIQENLEPDAEPTVWPQGVFELSKTNLSSLLKALKECDFGIFVFTPDDQARLRKKTYDIVRDNVVFELGLFTGRLGPDRVFMVTPNRPGDLRIPTDLAGVIRGMYDANRRDGNLQAALGPFCNQVRRALKKARARRPSVRPAGRPRARSVGNVSIHSAEYGVGASWRDVKRPLLEGLRRVGAVRVTNDLAGDPQRGTAKTLRLDFTYRGARHRVEIPEGGVVEFPR